MINAVTETDAYAARGTCFVSSNRNQLPEYFLIFHYPHRPTFTLITKIAAYRVIYELSEVPNNVSTLGT
jgi:hypothetical protein